MTPLPNSGTAGFQGPSSKLQKGGENLYAWILMVQFSVVITIHLSSGCVLLVISLETYASY